MQLTQIESVFRSLKSELGIRPIYHQLEHRFDAHIVIAFLAYCLQVTLKQRLLLHAPGLTPKAVLEKLADIKMIDVWIPTVDQRWLILPRYTACSTTEEHSRELLPSQRNFLLALSACSAYNSCMQYTIRNVPVALDEALRRAAREQDKSLNEVAIEALTRGAGLTGERGRQRDLGDIAGTWHKDLAFERALAAQDTIDEEMWR